jgi:hypothetical protein
MEQHVPDSIARTQARADTFKIEARADAAVRRHNDAMAETVNLIKTRADALLRRFDTFEERERQRAKDAAAKRKADAEAAIQRKVDAHSNPDDPTSWRELTIKAEPGHGVIAG